MPVIASVWRSCKQPDACFCVGADFFRDVGPAAPASRLASKLAPTGFSRGARPVSMTVMF